MVRLFFVYAVLFAVLLCVSSGLLGQSAYATTARVAVDGIELGSGESETQLFGNYFYHPDRFRGDFVKAKMDLTRLAAERKAKVEGADAELRGEMEKLRAEHRELMARQELSFADDPNSKWAIDLYQNIGRQAYLRQEMLDKVAGWDGKNWVEVNYEQDGEKFYVTELKVHREGVFRAAQIIASIR